MMFDIRRAVSCEGEFTGWRVIKFIMHVLIRQVQMASELMRQPQYQISNVKYQVSRMIHGTE